MSKKFRRLENGLLVIERKNLSNDKVKEKHKHLHSVQGKIQNIRNYDFMCLFVEFQFFHHGQLVSLFQFCYLILLDLDLDLLFGASSEACFLLRKESKTKAGTPKMISNVMMPPTTTRTTTTIIRAIAHDGRVGGERGGRVGSGNDMRCFFHGLEFH